MRRSIGAFMGCYRNKYEAICCIVDLVVDDKGNILSARVVKQ